MKSFIEKSTDIRNDLFWMWVALSGLALWTMRQIWMMTEGQYRMGDVVFIVMFLCLLIWRYAGRYEYVINDRELVVHKKLLIFESSIVIPFESVETFSETYRRKLVIRQRISRFYHWYASGDTRPTRVITYMQNKKRIVFVYKASDIFMDKLISRMPARYVPGI